MVFSSSNFLDLVSVKAFPLFWKHLKEVFSFEAKLAIIVKSKSKYLSYCSFFLWVSFCDNKSRVVGSIDFFNSSQGHRGKVLRIHSALLIIVFELVSTGTNALVTKNIDPMAWENEKMIETWLNVLNSLLFKLVVICRQNLFSLEYHFIWWLELTPDKNLSRFWICSTGMDLSSSDEIYSRF